jgi:hypothetical protein
VSKMKLQTVGAGVEWGATVLKLSSALFGLAAAGLFILPLFRVEAEAPVPTAPRYVTLPPLFSSETKPKPEPQPEAKPEPEASDSAPEAPSAAGPAIQEERSSFTGAILMVESQPPGANVRVNGVDQGETPVSVGLDCFPGRDLVVDFTLRGFEKSRHRTLCPKDALVKVTARLRKASGKSSGKK